MRAPPNCPPPRKLPAEPHAGMPKIAKSNSHAMLRELPRNRSHHGCSASCFSELRISHCRGMVRQFHRRPQLSVQRRHLIPRLSQHCGKKRSRRARTRIAQLFRGRFECRQRRLPPFERNFSVISESLIDRNTPPASRKYLSRIRTPGCAGLSRSIRTRNLESVSNPSCIRSAWLNSARYRTPSKVVSRPKPESAVSAWLLRCRCPPAPSRSALALP